MFGVRCTVYGQGGKTRPCAIRRTRQDTPTLLLLMAVRKPARVLECPQPKQMRLVGASSDPSAETYAKPDITIRPARDTSTSQ
jgi:hypothetical protein